MRSSRWIYLAGVLVFFGYALWMIGPYLRSTVLRDAAVTSWSNTATAPIAGIVELLPVQVGSRVGDDRVVARVRNDHLSRKALMEAQVNLDYAQEQVAGWKNFIGEIQQLDINRADLKSQYAQVFRNQLDTQIDNLVYELEVTSKQLDLISQIAGRMETLAQQGTVNRNAKDEALLRVAELEVKVAKLRSGIANAQARRAPASEGIFISENGNDPDWVRGSRMELKTEKKQARFELKKAESELRLAETRNADLISDFQRQSSADVLAQKDSVVWSHHVSVGTAVVLGSPILEWLDCSVLMVDVPVSDAEVSLINPGTIAEVILEGDPSVRDAKVLMTRGSAATLGKRDLAAIAKGRQAHGAQVLLDFSHEADSFETCPVGLAAHVNFPNIGLIDVIRARLRL